MLWTKDETSSINSYVNIFGQKSDEKSSGPTDDIHNEAEDREFQRRSRRYDQKFEELAKECRKEGKKLFGKKLYFEAMQEFNRCLMFAQPKSEEIALAYANRSACFFYLNMPTECLADIELAKVSNYPEDLMEKLDKRKLNCEQLQADAVKPALAPIREPVVVFYEHENFAGVANCLEIQKNSEFGHRVVSICDLDIGQVILIERPFSIVPTKFGAQSRNRCFHCFSKMKNFTNCSDCLMGFYCDVNCKRRDFHAIECTMDVVSDDIDHVNLLVKMFLNIDAAFDEVDFLVKIVDSLVKDSDIPDDLSQKQKDFCSLFELKINRENYSEEQTAELNKKSEIAYRAIMSLANIKTKYASEEHQCFVQHLILHLCYIIDRAIELNEFVRTEPNSALASYTFQHYATGIYTFGSHINHSCIPNISWFFVDDCLVCTVIRPIKKGDELFRSYFPGMESFMRDPKLKTTLENQYRVICKCQLCSNEMWAPLVDRVNVREDSLWKEGIAPILMQTDAFRKLSLDKIENHEKKAIEFLTKYNDQHPIRDTISMQECLQIVWNEVANI